MYTRIMPQGGAEGLKRETEGRSQVVQGQAPSPDAPGLPGAPGLAPARPCSMPSRCSVRPAVVAGTRPGASASGRRSTRSRPMGMPLGWRSYWGPPMGPACEPREPSQRERMRQSLCPRDWKGVGPRTMACLDLETVCSRVCWLNTYLASSSGHVHPHEPDAPVPRLLRRFGADAQLHMAPARCKGGMRKAVLSPLLRSKTAW